MSACSLKNAVGEPRDGSLSNLTWKPQEASPLFSAASAASSSFCTAFVASGMGSAAGATAAANAAHRTAAALLYLIITLQMWQSRKAPSENQRTAFSCESP
ncbi:MAG: hypothetical protein ACOYD3_01205 [Kiritimatiellia bacterium]